MGFSLKVVRGKSHSGCQDGGHFPKIRSVQKPDEKVQSKCDFTH